LAFFDTGTVKHQRRYPRAVRSRPPTSLRWASVAVSTLALLSACDGAGSSAAASSVPGTTVSSVDSAAAPKPRGPVRTGARVIRVVDGDTLHVDIDGVDTDVRLIGLNTPETVKPNSPIECYGPAASAFTKKMLTDTTVTIEYDDSQGRTDRFGRTLAYVWLERPGADVLFNQVLIRDGYAFEHQYARPYAWQREFVAAQNKAKAARLGLWGACPAR
jgi:micrococcal nuclease